MTADDRCEPVTITRTAQNSTTTDGKPPRSGYEHETAPGPIGPDGQHEAYWVLTPEERAKGFVRPVRDSYLHLKCGTVTKMSRAIAETYARSPSYYGSTFCFTCRGHFPVGSTGEFVWDDNARQKVGT